MSQDEPATQIPARHASTAVACQADPERWFDRRNRAHALQRCLVCPLRSPCAAEALAANAKFGMWAGIWIDDNLPDVAHYLHAIAQGPQADSQRAGESEHHRAPPQSRSQTVVSLPRVTKPTPGGCAGVHLEGLSLWVGVEVRSSGHCEVMMPGCRYSLDEIRCRVPDLPWRRAGDASALYAACSRCSTAVSNLNGKLGAQLGYVVGKGRPPQTTPFYWRQARWVLLDPAGQMSSTVVAA
jgi:hypothetical protein